MDSKLIEADCLIIGCGLSGSVIARFLAEELDKRVVIWERRNHIAGNMYDFKDSHGILVHKYGPHAFHTKKEYLYDYISRFGDWNPFYLTCLAKIDGIFTPSPFNFQTIDDFYLPEEAKEIKDHLLLAYPDRQRATILELIENSDIVIQNFAKFLFEKDYRPYTAKQWGIDPSKLDTSILKRVPIFFSYDREYFDDPYQIIPQESYTSIFYSILNHNNIRVELEVEALDYLSVSPGGNEMLLNGNEIDIPIIYTGALDELFQGSGASLPYRSLLFDWKYEEIESFQDAPVVAYPQAEGFTRITEYKKLPVQLVHGTTYAIEFPVDYKIAENEPYYPVLTEQSQAEYAKYKSFAEKIRNFYFCGRLADYKYYNMDQTLERALELCQKLKSEII